MEILSTSTEDTKKLAGSIAKKLKPGIVLALYGELGAGKTAFTNFLVKALGFVSRVQSPTFVVLRKYLGGRNAIKVINHIDLYRLTNRREIDYLGLEEILSEPGSISIIEWPELIEDLLPPNTMKIKFEHVGEFERKINVQSLS